MRLKHVKLFGFKTFADKTEFNLDGGFVAVVGSNGCGKSNLVDGILWGLGESNVRNIRAQHGVDVIFNGSARRKPLGYAEVSLTFDNEAGELPINASEVTISRKVSRSGDSEYRINRIPARQKDIYDLLADSGLGRSGYAIVGQKDIDAAVAASPYERRSWVDEAAGVQRYRQKKAESTRRLNAAKDHLQRTIDILNEIETQRSPLKAEAEVALRYRALQEELQRIEEDFLISEILLSKETLEKLEQQNHSNEKSRIATLASSETLDAELTAKGESISELEAKMDSVRSLHQSSLSESERIRSNIRVLEERLESFLELEKTLSGEGSEAEFRLTEADAELKEAKGILAEDEAALEQLRNSFIGISEESAALSQRLKEIESQIADARSVGEINAKNRAARQVWESRAADLRRELASIRKNLPELQKACEEANEDEETSKQELADQQLAVQAALSEIESLDEAGKKQKAKQDQLHSRVAALEGQIRILESNLANNDSLSAGSKAIIAAAKSHSWSGTWQAVGSSFSVSSEYALAIETALGGAVNDIIVDTESDAKKGVQFLKENRAGRCTFQPINLLRTTFNRVSKSFNGLIGKGSELISTDRELETVFESLLGRVGIVETLDHAIALIRQDRSAFSRLVTLDGEVVHANGAVTGGVHHRQTFGVVQQRAELGEAQAERDQLERAAKELLKSGSGIAEALDKAGRKLTESRAKLVEITQTLREKTSFADTLRRELADFEKSEKKISAELELGDGNLVSDAEMPDIVALEAERHGILKEFASRAADQEQFESRSNELSLRIGHTRSRISLLSNRIDSVSDSVQKRAHRIEHINRQREEAVESIAKSQEQIVTAEARIQAYSHDLGELTQQRQELLAASHAVSEELKGLSASLKVLTDLQIQNELEKARLESKLAQSAQRLIEEYGLTVSDAVSRKDAITVEENAPAKVASLRRELKGLGIVNLGAIEAYERLSVRFEELNGQVTDIQQGIEELENSIKSLDSLTEEKFLATFEDLKARFDRMFQRLFKGGQGELVLSNSEDTLESGVDMIVTLPGKRRQPLSLLSGGERSLCAMAFLFSLLEIKSSPLVILDEVDAPLDGANVDLFASLITDFSIKIQFIVITHNPSTISASPVWLGVTMSEPGVSTLVPYRTPEQLGRTAGEEIVLA